MSHPSVEPPLFSFLCEGKVQTLIILKHPAKLGWWGAQFPAQEGAIAIYL